MSIRIYLFISLMITLGLNVNAQPLTIQWQKCLGGSLGEAGYAIRQTADGGYLSGNIAISNDGDVSGNHGNHVDYWIVKLDSNGNLVSQNCFGGSDEDYLSSILVMNNGEFVITGIAGSIDGDVLGNHGPSDIWILKGDSTGSILWSKCFGGTAEEEASTVIESYNHDYVIIGSARSADFDVIGWHDSSLCSQCADVWLLKLDTSGAIRWAKCYGGYSNDIGRSLIETPDSGYIFAASVRSDDGDVSGNHGAFNGIGNEDFWVVKTDSFGSVQWQKCYGGSESEIPYDIVQTYDGGYVVAGTTTSNDFDVTGLHGFFNEDVWIVKIDGSGNLQWQKCLGGTETDICKKIIQLEDSSYLALCYTYSTDGDLIGNPAVNYDVWIVKLDQTGHLMWQQCMGGSLDDAAYDLQRTADGGVIFTGLTSSDNGDVSGNHGDFDAWVVKLHPLQNGVAAPTNSIKDFKCYLDQINQIITVNFYASTNENVQLDLFDATGRTILQQSLSINTGINKHEVYVGELNVGIYVVRVMNSDQSVIKKIIRD